MHWLQLLLNRRRVKAKFHYTGPTGPARTRTDFVGDPHGPNGVSRRPGPQKSPCGSGRARVVEFSYNACTTRSDTVRCVDASFSARETRPAAHQLSTAVRRPQKATYRPCFPRTDRMHYPRRRRYSCGPAIRTPRHDTIGAHLSHSNSHRGYSGNSSFLFATRCTTGWTKLLNIHIINK